MTISLYKEALKRRANIEIIQWIYKNKIGNFNDITGYIVTSDIDAIRAFELLNCNEKYDDLFYEEIRKRSPKEPREEILKYYKITNEDKIIIDNLNRLFVSNNKRFINLQSWNFLPKEKNVFINAIRIRNIMILDFLLKENYPYDNVSLYDETIKRPANIEMIYWLHKNKIQYNEKIFTDIIINEDIDTIAIFEILDFSCKDDFTCYDIFDLKNDQFVMRSLEKIITHDEQNMTRAIHFENIEAIKYLYERNCPIDINDIFDECFMCSCTDEIIDFLFKKYFKTEEVICRLIENKIEICNALIRLDDSAITFFYKFGYNKILNCLKRNMVI